METPNWLPPGKSAAVVFSIDDIHPGTSRDAYEAGGDLDDGALGHVRWLLDEAPHTWVTLFATPDWRQISPFPTRKLLAYLPAWHDKLYFAPVLPPGTMAVEKHPRFVEYLNAQTRMEVAFHGLHHIHPGPKVPVEFQNQDRDECRRMMEKARRHFDVAGLQYSAGFQPPAWNLPAALAEALVDVDIRWAAGARDIITPISADAKTAMSGPHGLSLIYPQFTDGGLLHFTSNFQATSEFERAFEIVENGGLVAIKGHIVKNVLGRIALDGVDPNYMKLLLRLYEELDRRYGDAIWWTSMGQIADYALGEPS